MISRAFGAVIRDPGMHAQMPVLSPADGRKPAAMR